MKQSLRIVLTLIVCCLLSFSGAMQSVPAARAAIGGWTQLSLSSVNVSSIAISPVLPSTVYAGTNGSGVYRSIDDGATWTAVNTGLTDMSVWAVAIDPTTTTTLYAGTDSNLFKSIDGAYSWVAVTGLPTGQIVAALAIDPVAGTLYAGIYGTGFSGGVYSSSDGGASWTGVNTGFGHVRALVVDPLTGTVYAGTFSNGTDGGVFASTDGGASWTAMNNGLGSLWVFSLAIDSTGTLYAGTFGSGAFTSADGGASWTGVNNGLTNGDVRSLAVNPITPATLYAGTNGSGVFTSVDSGANWTTTGLSGQAVRALAIDPVTPVTIYAGTSGSGVFRYDTTYTLTYTAGLNGTITGISPQTVGQGASGTEVVAVPDPGYQFAQWSDGIYTAARTDTNVMADINVTATFSALPPPATVSFGPSLTPGMVLNAGQSLDVPLVLSGDLVHAAYLDLYLEWYSLTGQGFSKITTVQVYPLDASQTYIWNIPADLVADTAYLTASVWRNDGTNGGAGSYSVVRSGVMIVTPSGSVAAAVASPVAGAPITGPLVPVTLHLGNLLNPWGNILEIWFSPTGLPGSFVKVYHTEALFTATMTPTVDLSFLGSGTWTACHFAVTVYVGGTTWRTSYSPTFTLTNP